MKILSLIFFYPLWAFAIDGEAGPGKNFDACMKDCEENRSVAAADLRACKNRCLSLPTFSESDFPPEEQSSDSDEKDKNIVDTD